MFEVGANSRLGAYSNKYGNKATFTQSNPSSLSDCENVDQNIDHACFFSVVDKLSGDR